MLPTQNTAIVAEGQALVIGQYKSAVAMNAILEAALEEVQDAEDALWDAINANLLTRTFSAGTDQGQLDGPPDPALLNMADFVGCPAGNFTTRQLAFLIPIWILARKSQARSEDLLGLLSVAFGPFAFYQEYYPAAFEVTAPAVADESLIGPLVQALTIARPPGVYAVLAWGAWLFNTFFFGDSSGSGGGSGFKDSVSGLYANGFLSAVVI